MAKAPKISREKASFQVMSDDRRLEVAAQFTDDVLSKLADAFFQVVKNEGWSKRDLSAISGINETAISHILAGRRKNLTIETIALLTRAMRKRPELILHDLRPAQNNVAYLAEDKVPVSSAFQEKHLQQPSPSAASAARYQGSEPLQKLEPVR
jgi:transcriptional regulator with XRE-family HTH domain